MLEATPAGCGFGSQFSLANVPRQLVTMGGGSGGGNTSNVTFTNNMVVGTAGVAPTVDCGSDGQGNNLVTIDTNGGSITGNTFAGATARFGVQLRARGPSTVISSNSFEAAGLHGLACHLFVQNTGADLATLLAADTFDGPVDLTAVGTATTGSICPHALSIVKTSTTTAITAAGQVVPYHYEATNTRSVTQTMVAVSDDNTDAAPSCSPQTLAQGETAVCSAQHTVTQGEVDAGGTLTNVAAATSDESILPSETHLDIPIEQTPALELAKDGVVDTGVDGLADVGDPIVFTLTATNTGNVTLADVAISDPGVSALVCPAGNPAATLAPGASVVCTGSYPLTLPDLLTGSRSNSAAASATGPGDGLVESAASIVVPIATPAVGIPTLNPAGAVLLVLFLAAAGLWLRRRRPRGRAA